ncbi:glycosyl hydrolases family 18-domain-containing protein [Hypoxylon sp. NC0597]|nr:glycosyl hydrolases family 18-domain-containing protein [Hypoxylon sp. NC0597]
MEPYVDFFGLMTYDLHGPWDASVKDIGKTIIGQTNIPEIYNWTSPLWYDGVDPSKINLGLAYYGRGYTVESVDCMEVGCKWSTTSRPAPCTAFGGVMSLEEIQSLMIPQIGVDPILDSDAMMKYLVWSDQWVGYDDSETIAMKKNWASSHCFGGTMIWSIDLYSGSGSGNTPDGGGDSSSGDPGAGGGNDGSSEGSGGDSIVYIDPSIWGESNPVINCEPPCTFVLPPLKLPSAVTIDFPLFPTSLDVAWSASTGWTHIIQTTTLTIPQLVVTEIPVWEYTVTDTNTATSASKTFYVTSSILPPPFKITNDPNPLSEPGVTHSPVTRTITPPPFPYSFVNPSSSTATATTSSSSGGFAGAIFPVVTYKPGKPGPICKSGCGKPCLMFCSAPCLINCADGGNDFVDPEDPDPPSRPTQTEVNDPMPTGTIATSTPRPVDDDGDDPGDEEEEDEDDSCAYEFGLPAPTYVDPNFGASGTQSISPPKPPPTPPPKPNPAPPSPNPATEKLHCFDSGAMTGRGSMIDAVNTFCNQFEGTILDASDANAEHTLTITDHNAGVCLGALGCTEALHLSVTVTNGCRFTIDGPSPDQECGRIFRQAIDKCDTSSTKYKQGGTITSNCAVWDIDPNNWW